MNRSSIFKLLTAVLMLVFLPAFSLTADTEISIYYTSSLNGNLIGCDCKGVPKAGLSTTASYLRGIDSDNSIILDLGDFNDARTDELLSNTLIELYDEIGYDFSALGDQELGSGIEYFKTASKSLDFICNNIKIDGRLLSPAPVVITRTGIKIGIASVIDPNVFFFYPDDVKRRIEVLDFSAAADRALSELEKSGSDFNILLFHGNLEGAKELYKAKSGWDAVLSAHDQVLFEQQDGNRIIASPGEEGNRVGRLDLTFRFKRLTEVSNSMRYFKYEVDPEDPGVLQAFEDYKKELIQNLKNGKK